MIDCSQYGSNHLSLQALVDTLEFWNAGFERSRVGAQITCVPVHPDRAAGLKTVGNHDSGEGTVAFPAQPVIGLARRPLAHVPAKWVRFADKDMRQHENLRRFPVIMDH